jgi:hypothetical protein
MTYGRPATAAKNREGCAHVFSKKPLIEGPELAKSTFHS